MLELRRDLDLALDAVPARQRGIQAPEISVKMDTAGIEARRIVQRWMEKEAK